MLLLSLVACNFTMKKPATAVNKIVSPIANPTVNPLIVETEDEWPMDAWDSQYITGSRMKVLNAQANTPVSFKITKLPAQGELLLDGVKVELGQNISTDDVARGAFSYNHLGLPGEDEFEFKAWNKNTQSVNQTFKIPVQNPGPRACSANNGSGIQTWLGSEFSACEISACDEGFYLAGSICLPQICVPNEVATCPMSNGSGTKTCNGLGNDFSSCSLGICDAGFHPIGQICELNIKPCAIAGGVGSQVWTGAAYTACSVVSCSAGFFQSGNSCLAQTCSPLSSTSCPIENGAGSRTCNLLGSAYGSCTLQSCAAGYQINGNQCDPLPVTCSYSPVSGPVYDRMNLTINPPTSSGYQVAYRLVNPISGVSLNTTTGAISIANTQVQNYNIQVEAYSITGVVQCGVNFNAVKSLRANDDTKSTGQGQSLVIPISDLLTNDQSLSGKSFSFTSTSLAFGGSVVNNGATLTFTPSVFGGEAAGFTYTITDADGRTDSAVVTVTIEPLGQLDALIYNADEMADMLALLNTAPPTMADVFASWARFENTSYYANQASASGQALSWEFKTAPDRVESTINSTRYIGFVSPEKLDNYILQTDVSSTDNDDDAISLLVAFVRSGSNIYTLSAVRTTGGTHTNLTQGWALVYNYMQADQVIVQEKNVGGVFQNNEGDGWSGKSSRLKIERNEDSVKIWASNWTSTTLGEASLISLDLNSHSRYAVFKGKQSYGFGAFSQKNSTFKNITLQGGSNLNSNKIYDIDNEQVWIYSPTSGWSLSTENFADSLGFPRTIFNPKTNKFYTIDQSGVVTPQ